MPPKPGRNPFKLNKNNAYHLLIIVYQSFSFVSPQAKASRQHRSQALCAEELPQVADRPGITCPERCWAAITWASIESRCPNTKISQRSPGEVSNDDETIRNLPSFTSFQSWATHQAKYTKPSFCGACCAATRWCQVGNIYLSVSRISLIWHSVLSVLMVEAWPWAFSPMLIMYKLGLSWTWIFSRICWCLLQVSHMNTGWIPGSDWKVATCTPIGANHHPSSSPLRITDDHFGSWMYILVVDKAGPTIPSLKHTHTPSNPFISSVSTKAISSSTWVLGCHVSCLVRFCVLHPHDHQMIMMVSSCLNMSYPSMIHWSTLCVWFRFPATRWPSKCLKASRRLCWSSLGRTPTNSDSCWVEASRKAREAPAPMRADPRFCPKRRSKGQFGGGLLYPPSTQSRHMY